MTIEWSLFAVEDREAIFAYIEADSPRAAVRHDDQIESQVEALVLSPGMGRPGRVTGTRELILVGTSYIAAYTINGDVIKILRVLHGARLWPAEL